MPHTLYIAPGVNQCRVYLMPYSMRPGQNPSDLMPEYQQGWKQVALLNRKLEVVFIAPAVAHLRNEIAGQMGGTFFELDDDLQLTD